MSELEQDYEALVAQINAKIKESAEALNEANALATKAGLPTLIYTQFLRDDMKYDNDRLDEPLSRDEVEAQCEALQEKLEAIDVGPLEAALSDGGWSTSSSYC